MNKSLLTSDSMIEVHSPNQVFFCPEESQFYAQCLEKMVFSQGAAGESIVEFGAGDGSPVIRALLKSSFDGVIQGFELNPDACALAQLRIEQYGLGSYYQVHNMCFFDNSPEEAECLIANPPYLPAPDDQLYMPSLHGGHDGASITKQLLAHGCERVMLMISAYSNPVDTVDYALQMGYQIADFMVSPLKFGYYSCEPKVRNTITELQRKRKAFFSEKIYFLAGVLFEKDGSDSCLSEEFLKVMTAL
ncbi:MULTISPECIES: SAM-dependent methyltransferase [unclassified Leptolyngbya]|uniref:SAM-dependent methyltransferase n=1 Tax=unclassified Leptolyngbya TaxID=2650499 RepID=UPI001683B420|nr:MULTISPECIES: SAM-dependent methyltransferase [unclassified Leptolyngbya]MBD1914017.1 SAM-dependent methyltransferase [Leptolyngbya sp. FACHB-8]MBD2154028.1 SAM-dependent methyltransferase [Leptolyngbya sp. FACHB-16]